MSSHTTSGHGYRPQDRHCVSHPGETGGFQGLPGTLLLMISLGLHPQTQLQARLRVTFRLRLALCWWAHPSNLARESWGRGIGGCQHIKVLELRSAQLALRKFLPHLQDRHVLLRTDSVVAAAYINKQGGLGSSRLCRLTHKLWVWASPCLLSLKAVQVPGLVNQAAARGGRISP